MSEQNRLWPEQTNSEKLESLKTVILQLCKVVDQQHQAINQLMQHTHKEDVLVVPIARTFTAPEHIPASLREKE